MSNTQVEQREWLQRVIRQTGLAPTALALKCGLAVTTLTRFLNDPDHSTALSARTIGTIERATGMRFGAHAQPSHASGFRETEAVPFDAAPDDSFALLVSGLTGAAMGIDPWILQSRVLETAGFLPGDVLIVDLTKVPEPGDVVCAQLYDWHKSKAETIFRIWEPPYLVSASQEARHRRPQIVDNDNVVIKGVVVASLRPRQGRSAA